MSTPTREQIGRALARAIRSLRGQVNISQEDLALKAGLDRSHVGEIERCAHAPTAVTLGRLFAALGVSWAEFGAEMDKHLRKRPKPQGESMN